MDQNSNYPLGRFFSKEKTLNDRKKGSPISQLVRSETEYRPRSRKYGTNGNHDYFVQNVCHDQSNDQRVQSMNPNLENGQVHCSSGSFETKPFSHNTEKSRRGPRGGVVYPFPEKLHLLLENVDKEGHSDIISWRPHGRCFIMHQPKEFVKILMPMYFRQTKLTSFQRQLNLYGFCRLTSGFDKGAYYHKLFLRGKPLLCKKMIRIRIKGTGIKSGSNPESEPNFYTMPSIQPDGPLTAPSSPKKNSDSWRYGDTQGTKTITPVSPQDDCNCFHDERSFSESTPNLSTSSKSITPSSYQPLVAMTNSIPTNLKGASPRLPLLCSLNSEPKDCGKFKLPFQTMTLNSDSYSRQSSVTRDQAVKFEGRQFHYLDSFISSYEYKYDLEYDDLQKEYHEDTSDIFLSRGRSVTLDGKNDPVIEGKSTPDVDSDWYSGESDDDDPIIPTNFFELVGIPIDSGGKISDNDDSSFD